ncbi:MAG: YaiI/YqxD family protein [Woeseiaceae bacterium]|nr:YaiI/YqxD family protein [Woeseiaceae bacterium]
MNIWVDADACPGVIKDILYRAAQRTGIPVTLVANHALNVPRSPFIRTLQVPHGADVADSEIVRRLAAGDLVITADIPLAAEVVDKAALALNPRGELYTRDNIRARLNMRDFLDSLRGSGIDTGGPAALSQADRKAFAGHLDRILASHTVNDRAQPPDD